MEGDQKASKTRWYFPDAYLPDISDHISHEAVCVLNAGREEAELRISLYFEDREPMEDFLVICPPDRTRHIRFDRLTDQKGRTIPCCVPYSICVRSNIPVMCQYTRVDATKPAYALMTTMGLSE